MLHGRYGSLRFSSIPQLHLTIAIKLVVIFALINLVLRLRKQSKGCRQSNRNLLGIIQLLRPSFLLWIIPEVTVLIILREWCTFGLYKGSSKAIVICCDLAFLGTLISTLSVGLREWTPLITTVVRSFVPHVPSSLLYGRSHASKDADVTARDSHSKAFIRGALCAITLCTISILSECALNLSWNDSFNEYGIYYFAIETIVVTLAILVAFFISQRHGGGVALVSIVCWAIGVAQYFVIEFKGVSIQPSDLYGLTTAAEVANAYVYVINENVVASTNCMIMAVSLSSVLWTIAGSTEDPPAIKPYSRLQGIRSNAVGTAACLVVLLSFTFLPNYQKDLGVKFGDWNTVAGVKQFGLIPSFIQTSQRTKITKPKGYSTSKATELLSSYVSMYDQTLGLYESRLLAEEQFNYTRPTVIAIMNESFSDLSTVDLIRDAGYNGPQFIKYELTDALQTGTLDVSVQGGGTCNSEFEFLTGYSIGLVGPTCPYVVYRMDKIGGLVNQFKSLGYGTTAIHPNVASNWNRQSAYKQLGFDQFLDIGSFPADAAMLHAGVTDATTYDKILEVLYSTDEPQFIFDVTMQNHGGYTMGNTPEHLLTSYHVDAGDDASLNEYISIINSSDGDLRNFIEQLRWVDRPIVLVFFGDHQPGISVAYNQAMYGEDATLDESEQAYQTLYTIWANYNVAGNTQTSDNVRLNTSTLGANLMYQIGAPLTNYQKTQLVTNGIISQISSLGYQDVMGAWHEFGDEDGSERATLNDLQNIFYLEFASKV